MSRSYLSKGPRSNDCRIRRSPEKPHDETVRLIEPADLAAAGLAGDLETGHAVEGAYDVADDIRPFIRRGEAQTSAVKNCQLVRQNRMFERTFPIEKRRDRS